MRRITARRPAPAASSVDLRDERVLRAVYAEHGAELYGFARHRLADDGLAQETVQEVFVRAWRAADRFDPQLASLRSWLFAIARNVVIDLARHRAARPGVTWQDQIPEQGAPVDGFDDAVITSWMLEEGMRRIAPQQREALVETYLRGRPYAEVAADLAVPVGTLRSRVFYGLKALRLALDEMGVEP